MECRKCGECCQIIEVHLSTNLSPDDRNILRWKGAKIIGDKVRIRARCMHLTGENQCEIYEDRPLACKAYRCEDICLEEKK